MRLAQYAKAARQTAIYPIDMRIIYPALGLADEVGELLVKLTSAAGPEAIHAEMGDVLWYIVNLATDCTIPVHKLVDGCETCAEIEDKGLLPDPNQFVMLAADAGAICGLVKKLYRDDNSRLTDERWEKIREGLGMILLRLAALTKFRKWSLGDIARKNLTKLASRQTRGTLHGDGDNR
jgi:NTP pyrophosphatase (non-canonical NTP hydrolase)